MKRYHVKLERRRNKLRAKYYLKEMLAILGQPSDLFTINGLNNGKEGLYSLNVRVTETSLLISLLNRSNNELYRIQDNTLIIGIEPFDFVYTLDNYSQRWLKWRIRCRVRGIQRK